MRTVPRSWRLALLAGGILLLVGLVLGTNYVLDHRAPPQTINLADDPAAVNPYRGEMDCYNQVLQTSNISARDANERLATCRNMGPPAPPGAAEASTDNRFPTSNEIIASHAGPAANQQ